MRNAALIIVFLFFLSAMGQKPSTVEQSKTFISKTLKLYAYKDSTEGIRNNYIVSFTDSIMSISNLQGFNNYHTSLKIWDIDTLIFLERKHNVWLTIQLKPGRRETTIVNSTPLEDSSGMYEFLLNRSFKEDGGIDKLRMAFTELTYGFNENGRK